MSENRKKVLVGMSGGIDSSAVCIMLQEQGYEVVGLTMRVWDSGSTYIEDAKELAATLGIQHIVADEREQFRNTIVKYFIDEYMNGRTPNPCVMCNPMFKFRILGEYADRLGCDYIATGHYSQIEERNGRHFILTGMDPLKDQSYFLWRLGEEYLSRILFPLGGMTKKDVRAYLAEKGFEAKASSGESMEVCFIKGDYRDFIREEAPELTATISRGSFVDTTGRKIGEHAGCPYYTVGQRKGLGIALGHPAYVLKINAEKNTVMLGTEEQLRTRYMLLENARIVDCEEFFSGSCNMSVRIRYRSRPLPCKVCRLDGDRLLVRFDGEASAVTPGQSAVFYDGRRMLGGAFIASQKGLGGLLANEEELVFV